MSVWDLSRLDDRQRSIIGSALSRCDFPFERLAPELRSEVGRDAIPVEFADLSRYSAQVEAEGHSHADDAHILAGEFDGRRAALGLAWYSGKVSIEARLVDDPDLAVEVFLAEGAHMVDFFYVTDDQREHIFDAYHDGTKTPHEHGWFEETGNHDYWSWVGESFMAGFTRAYAPAVPIRLEARQPWVHPTTDSVAGAIINILTPERATSKFVGVVKSRVYHRPDCKFMTRSPNERPLTNVEVELRRACRICRPDVERPAAPAGGWSPSQPRNRWVEAWVQSLPWRRVRG